MHYYYLICFSSIVKKKPTLPCSQQDPNVNPEMPGWSLSVWDTPMLLSDVPLKNIAIKH